MDSALSEILVFKLFRAETATSIVASPAIVITLDIIKYRRPHDLLVDKVRVTVDLTVPFIFASAAGAARVGSVYSGRIGLMVHA